MKTFIRKKIVFAALPLLVIGLVLPFSQPAFSNQNAPEISSPQLNFDEGARVPSSSEESFDPLSELESLLDSPSAPVAQVAPVPEIQKVPELKVQAPVQQKAVKQVKQAPRKVREISKVSAQPKIKNNEIQSVSFSKKGSLARLLIKAKRPLSYTTQENLKNRQVSLIFENTTALKKVRRSYDTKEFNSPLTLFSLSQTVKNRVPQVKLILQMREMTQPQIELSRNSLQLEFADKMEVAKREVTSETIAKDPSAAPIRKLELKNVGVDEALRLIARSSGYNLVLGDEVKGNIGTLSLENIPWDQAFNLVLQMKKLGYVRDGNILRVASLETLKGEREEEERLQDVEPLKTALIPISYAKANTLAPRGQNFLSKRGKLDTDDTTNTIIIRDVQSVIERLQKLYAVLDTQPPAVAISAKFVEIKKEFTRTLGLGAFNMAGQTSGINFGTAQAAPNAPGFGATSDGGTITISAPRFAALNAQLQLGESEQKVKVLANPTITVQQNQTGNITQGKSTDVPQSAGVAGATVSGLSQTANLTLDVTPIVANDGSISLKAKLLQEIPQNTFAATGPTLRKDTRSINTQIILQNGDTAVLGGVFSGQETDSSDGVPFLKNLPLLGYLFSQKTKAYEQNEVLIFITARILNPEAAFKQNI